MLLRRAFATKASPRWKRYGLRGVGQGVAATIETLDGHTLQTDIPVPVGGTDAAAQPVYLLLAGLVGCEQATAAFVARQMKIQLGTVQFALEAVRDERGALALPIHAESEQMPAVSRLQRIEGTATVDTTATQAEIDALAKQVKIRCPIAKMVVDSGCELDVKWVVKALDAAGCER